MRPFRVEVRYPAPMDRKLEVVEFDTKDEAIKFANQMVRLADKMRAAGYPAAHVNGEVNIYGVERLTGTTVTWIELTPVKDWREENTDGQEAPPRTDPRPWRR